MNSPDKIRCDACPVMCYISEGKTGACDRYANHDGKIIRCDPLTIIDRRLAKGRQNPTVSGSKLGRTDLVRP
jgi:hypothetical protein